LTLLKLYVGASVCQIALIALLLNTLPLLVIICSAASVVGCLLCISGLDDILLDKGAINFVPDWVNSFIAERDLFDIWVDFIMENNPITALVRLAGIEASHLYCF